MRRPNRSRVALSRSAINIAHSFERVSEPWSPRIIASMNDVHFKIARIHGEFVWHSHPETDEAFLVLDGAMRIEFRDGHVDLDAGEMYVVPRGVEHRPVASRECRILLVEPAGTVNTGDAGGDRTVAEQWLT
jgi:mannose-6-phosphate isomerase-like protein (cupin superfamily)